MSDSAAGDPEFQRRVEQQVQAIRNRTPYHSIEAPDGKIIEGIIPVEHLRERLNRYPIPLDLRGKRMLDVGAGSGWNRFELEKRSAAVVAVDGVEFPEFLFTKHAQDSKTGHPRSSGPYHCRNRPALRRSSTEPGRSDSRVRHPHHLVTESGRDEAPES